MTANSARRLWMGVPCHSPPESPILLMLSSAVGGLRGRLCFFIVISSLLSSATVVSCGRSVGYDHRALLLDGQRRFLISGSIHYPRSTPHMWPTLLSLAKEGGLDVIDTYVFWNGHEPAKGQYNFQDGYDLLGFLRAVQEADLLVTLRIGPYVCAEWNLGGLPNWLLDIPGIEFRTDNEPFKAEMERFVRLIVTMLHESSMFYTQGGPIILAQIENEYRHVAKWYGDAGRRYSDWAANMAIGLNTSVPWIMSAQAEAPEDIIITCNGFYCDDFQPTAYNKPKFLTEIYPGWAHYWGQSGVRRPVEDVAFAVARFFQNGGSLINYYMYHGGTNFGRTAAAGITTSYDFFAPIDEYGQVRYPEWSHLAQLHAAIKLCAPALTGVDGEPSKWTPGRYLEIYVYNSTATTRNRNDDRSSSSLCAAFLTNRDSTNDAIIQFQGQFYHVPAWSVSILPDCKKVLFNTATVIAQTSTKKMVPLTLDQKPDSATNSTRKADIAARRGKQGEFQHETNCEIVDSNDEGGGTGDLQWEWFREPVGMTPSGEENLVVANKTLEQFSVTQDSTDYLWYSTTINLSNSQTSQESPLWLNVRKAQKVGMLHVFINGDKVSDDHSPTVLKSSSFYSQFEFHPYPGTNTIDLLSATLGHPSSGPWIEARTGGISGSISVEGQLSSSPSVKQIHNHHLDLTHFQWKHQVGLKGEHLHLESEDKAPNDGKSLWASSGQRPVNEPLVWYKTTVDFTGSDVGPVALDLKSMKKGLVWMNGHHLGRYWPQQINPSRADCSAGCDYRGRFRAIAGQKCLVDCEKSSQRWYHVPREWLKPSGNRLVLFEEIGGDPSGISISRPVVHSVCADISELAGPTFPRSQETNLQESFRELNLDHPNLDRRNLHMEENTKSMSPQGQLSLDCGPRRNIAAIKFASLGNPLGTCGNFTQGSCHAPRSEDVVKEACIGHQHCRLRVHRTEFVGTGEEDSCLSTPKLRLAVQALCIQS